MDQLPHYLKRALAMMESRPPEPGELIQMMVAHDDGCPGLDGGTCTCVPDVTLLRAEKSS